MSSATQDIDPGSASSPPPSRPYGDHAATLWGNGYTPLPVRPGQKAPAIADWQLRPNLNLLLHQIDEEAERFPGHNIGVVMGENLLCVDVDTHERAQVEAIETICHRLGWWRCARLGKKGFALFLRVDTPFTMKGDPSWSVAQFFDHAKPNHRKAAVEILTRARQVVVPPSIHPDTQLPYEWITPYGLENTDIGDLPEATAAQMMEFLRTLAELGIHEGAPRSAGMHEAGAELSEQAKAAIEARKLTGEPRLNTHALLPHAVAHWLHAVETVAIPCLRQQGWDLQMPDYLSPGSPCNRGAVWKFICHWRDSGLSEEKVRQGVWRKRACSIKPWDPVSDPGATYAGIKDHGNAAAFDENTFTPFGFIVRLLTPKGVSPEWINDNLDWRRWIVETLKASAPEFADDHRRWEASRPVFELPEGFGPSGARA